MTRISVKELTHVYRQGEGDLTALSDVDFTVDEGEFVSVIGPSGCGKTTLLRIVGGLLSPTAGSVEIGHSSPVVARRRQEIGFVFQDPSLLPWRTVAKNVALPLELQRNRVDSSTDQKIDDLLDTVDLQEFRDYYPHELSGGMKQRVALARTLATQPRILLMDEPLGSLDEITRTTMRYEILNLLEQHPATVLFVTHSIAEAVMLSDKVIVLTGQPGQVLDSIQIDLPKPRTSLLEYSQEFIDCTARVKKVLMGAARGQIAA